MRSISHCVCDREGGVTVQRFVCARVCEKEGDTVTSQPQLVCKLVLSKLTQNGEAQCCQLGNIADPFSEFFSFFPSKKCPNL